MYLFDANAFIEASRLYYSFDIAPRYWTWLEEQSAAGHVGSVRAVYDEIEGGGDELADWVKNHVPDTFWLPEDGGSLTTLATAAAWALHPDRVFTQAAQDEFMNSADLRLVAQAASTQAIVVTRETPDANCRRRVKLPDAAGALGVVCVQPFAAYVSLGLQFS